MTTRPAAHGAYLDGELDEARAFWAGLLQEAAPVARFPADHPGEVQPHDGCVTLPLDGPVVDRLFQAAGNKVGLAFAVLVSSVAIVVQRYTAGTELIVGTGPNTRGPAWSPNEVLPVRLRVEPGASARLLLPAVTAALQQAYTHQKYPLQRLPGGTGRPLGVMIDCDQISPSPAGAPAEIAFRWNADRAAFTLRITYSSRRFTTASVQLLGEQCLHALARILETPDVPVGDLELMDPAERDALARAAAETAAAGRPAELVSRFREQVRRTPRNTAITVGDRHVSYAELAAAVDRLASLMAAHGAGPGTRVAVCLDHGVELVTAVWAALSCGAAYVPVDPGHPPARIRATLQDADPVVVATAAPCVDQVSGEGRTLLRVDHVDIPGGAVSTFAPPPPLCPAYVIYTSGSTGRPKGVVISHGALANYVWWAAGLYAATAPSDFPLYSSVSFDLTVTSIFVPLVTGNRIVVYPQRAGVPSIFTAIAGNDVDVLKLTPSHLAMIRDLDSSRSRIRTFVVGGEALDVSLAREIDAAFGGRAAIYNEYGPTEATVGCSVHCFDRDADDRQWVPIGRPAANTTLFVLDRRLRPVPRGVPGRLFIGGDGLAQAYWNQPAATAERFVPSPFGAGERLYDSGDLARRLPDGGLEFLGRTDHQAKLRGVRVELEEIRSALNRHPGIRNSVVVLRPGGEGAPAVLVAYYVSRSEIDVGSLRAFLGLALLPETMPAAFVHLRRLPLTINGKVDVAALPQPEQPVEAQAVETRSSPIEELVLTAWRDVLGNPHLRHTDNFFEAGGHSLLAAKCAARLQSVLNVNVPVRDLFFHPTANAFARQVEAALRGGPVQDPPIRRAPRAGPIPLSYAQQRLWFLDRLDPGNCAYNVPLIVRLAGTLDGRALSLALTDVARRHDALRTCFRVEDGEPAQVVGAPAPVSIRRIDLGQVPGAEAMASRIARREMLTGFDLTAAPLMRVVLVALASDQHLLCVTLHHIICDGWSLGILLDDFAAAYTSFAAGRQPSHPEPVLQYADFASWQRDRLAGEALDLHLRHWRTALADLPDCTLPFDRDWPQKPTHDVGRIAVSLPPDLTRRLEDAATKHGATLFMVLLAAYELVVGHVSNQRDVAVGVSVANRNRLEVDRIVGCFVNTLVIRTTIDPAATLSGLLDAVRARTLRAYAHEDVPFDLVVKELAPERYLGRSPLFSAKFVFQAGEPGGVRLPGLTATVVPSGKGALRSPMTLTLDRTGNGLEGSLDYSADLFDAGTMRLVYEELMECLSAMSEGLTTTVADATARLNRLRSARRASLAARAQRARADAWDALRVASSTT